MFSYIRLIRNIFNYNIYLVRDSSTTIIHAACITTAASACLYMLPIFHSLANVLLSELSLSLWHCHNDIACTCWLCYLCCLYMLLVVTLLPAHAACVTSAACTCWWWWHCCLVVVLAVSPAGSGVLSRFFLSILVFR